MFTIQNRNSPCFQTQIWKVLFALRKDFFLSRKEKPERTFTNSPKSRKTSGMPGVLILTRDLMQTIMDATDASLY